jgi:hypothetical protein
MPVPNEVGASYKAEPIDWTVRPQGGVNHVAAASSIAS